MTPFKFNYLLTKKALAVIFMLGGLVFYAAPAISQRQFANNWAFPRLNGLDFSSGQPVPFATVVPATGSNTKGTSAISDIDGNLVFYCNGEKAWNSSNTVLTNGGNLYGNQEVSQSSIIVPLPNSANRYMLFTLDNVSSGNGLYYYTVDMNSSNGIVSSGLQLDSIMTEKLCATKHSNDLDYWVVAHKWHSDSFMAYHVDTFGVNATPVISKVGMVHTGGFNGSIGQMKISPDGTMIALAGWLGNFVELFSFDNTTGVVSAPLTISNYSQNFPFGIEFSPDSRKLYYAQRFSQNPEAIIFQYDLDHLDTACLLASEFELGHLPELKIPSNLQLGTDGKIYLAVNYFSTYDTLTVINKPNLLGADAEFVEFGISTNSPITEGLCNFASSFVSDGIHVVFGTTCSDYETILFPEDTLLPDSVRWNFGDPTSANNSSTQFQTSHVFSGSDTFLVTLFAFRGSEVDTFYRDVIIWEIPQDLLGNDTTICDGGAAVTLEGSWKNSCIYWFDNSSSPTVEVNTQGWYWVDVYYQSCYFRDSLFVEGVDGPPEFSLGEDVSVCNNFSYVIDPDLQNAYYTWQDGSHDTTYTVTQTGVYSLTATNACGNSVDSLVFTVNQTAQPTLNLPLDTIICDTAEFILVVTFDDASYLWSDGSTKATKTITISGQYWVRVSNICDTVSDTMNVDIDSVVAIDLADREVICSDGEPLVLIGNVDSTVLNWSTGLIGKSLEIVAPGKYWASMQNACGVSADTIQVLQWDTSYKISLGKDTVICDDSKSVEIGWTDDSFPFQFLWSDGVNEPVREASTGIYSLTATNRCASLEAERKFSPAEPISILDNSTRNICEGESLSLAISSNEFKRVVWSSEEETPKIFVTQAGSYSVKITDSNDCVFSDSFSVTDFCPALARIPNVMTPNADGINDEICFEFENIQSAETWIFDRWGLQVFYAGGSEIPCWDSKFRGLEQSEGTFYYVCNVLNKEGNKQSYRGSFSLLR
jgi:gliding motility-associated-like protein